MENELYGLHYEFEQGGSTLLFTREQALSENDLVPIETKMLLNYPNAKLLSLQLIEVDLQIKLRYMLESKRSLSQIGSINESECFRIFYTIVSTIDDSKLNLLNEARYLLQEQFIYLGADYTEVKLIYLPIQELPGKSALQEELFQLITCLLNKTENILSPRDTRILQYLKSPSFQLAELKEKLIHHVTEAVPLQFVEHEQVKPSLIKFEQKQGSTEANKRKFQKVHTVIRKRLKGNAILTKYNPFLVVVCIFMFISTWSLYFLLPSTGMFNLCLGVSLLILHMCLYLNRKIDPMDTDELMQHQSYGQTPNLELKLNAAEQTKYYEQLSDQTTLLVPYDATVLLPPPIKAYLELNVGDRNERINISGDTFIIGRNPEAVQYKVDWIGVSRTHLEISREGKEYEAKDLNSKNGSFLNDTPMIPLKSYGLVDGDCIKIVEKQFVYKKNS